MSPVEYPPTLGQVMNNPDPSTLTKHHTVKVDLYSIRGRAVKDGAHARLQAHGLIEFGHKTSMDVVHNHVRYKPPPAMDDDDDTDPDWIDISSSVKTVDDREEGLVHYVKVVEPVVSPWAFDITITNPGEGGSFEGTYTSRDGTKFEWKGRRYITADVVTEVEVAPEIPKPSDLKEGSIAALMSLSPFAFKDEGFVKKGQDGAQVLGDMMWQKISMHSLKADVRERVLQSLEPLTPSEKALMKKHSEFFHRFGVHDFAERLRKMEGLDRDITKHIFYKRHWFLKAMTCYQVPKSGEVDPVEEYGLKRNNAKDMAMLKKLQDSYRDVTKTCYEAGFIEFRSEWKTYLKHPRYWFQVLANYLVSETHVDSWLSKLDPSCEEQQGHIPPQVQVMHWGNKLALLKHALGRTDPEAAAALNLDQVVSTLNTATIHHYALAQAATQDLTDHINQVMVDTEFTQKIWAQHTNEMTANSEKMLTVLRQNAYGNTMKITSPDSSFYRFIVRLRNSCSPPTLDGPAAYSPPTCGEMLRGLDKIKVDRDWDKVIARVTKMNDDELRFHFEGLYGVAELFEEEMPRVGWKQWAMDAVKDKGRALKRSLKSFGFYFTTAKAMVHLYAAGSLMLGLRQNWATMDKVEIWRSLLQIASTAFEYVVGKGGRWLFTKLYAMYDWGSRVSGKLVTWLSEYTLERGATLGKRFLFSTVGNLYKILRMVGLITCVLGIISLNSDLEKANTMSAEEAKTFKIFNRIQFWLGITEVCLIGLEMLFEIAGFAVAASWCGALGMVVGVIGIIAMIVYFVWFAPGPLDWIKKWLEEEGILGGSYDKSRTNEETEPGITV